MIPLQSLLQITDKQYLEPKDWLILKDTDKNQYYTLKNEDIIVKGIVTDSINSPRELKEKYDNVLQVVSVNDNRYGSEDMHHFSLKAK